MPAQIDFVKAHGTGTLLGDMVEAKALAHAHRRTAKRPAVSGRSRATSATPRAPPVSPDSSRPSSACTTWSRRRASPNRRTTLGSTTADCDARRPMELPAETAHAGVCSFGLGGTNCHMVFASAPAAEPRRRNARMSGDPHLVGSFQESAPQRITVAGGVRAQRPLSPAVWSTNRIKASGKARWRSSSPTAPRPSRHCAATSSRAPRRICRRAGCSPARARSTPAWRRHCTRQRGFPRSPRRGRAAMAPHLGAESVRC